MKKAEYTADKDAMTCLVSGVFSNLIFSLVLFTLTKTGTFAG